MKGETALRSLLTGNKAREVRNFSTKAHRIKHKRQKPATEKGNKIRRRGRNRCMLDVLTTKKEAN
jgi:hypothetical protein